VAFAFLFCVVLAQMLLTSVAVYAASIANTTARALVLALATLIAAGCLLQLLAFEHPYPARELAELFRHISPSPTVIVGLLTASIFIPLSIILSLAYRCFRARELTRNLLRYQVPLLVLVLCFLAVVFATFVEIVRTADKYRVADSRHGVSYFGSINAKLK